MEELDVILTSECEGKYECALIDEEGNEKHKFTIEFSYEDLEETFDYIIDIGELTQNALEEYLKEEIIGLIIEKCREFDECVNYHNLSIYDNLAAGVIVSRLSTWIEQRVYDYFNSIYGLSNEQLEEMKKFYNEGIDLNLAIERTEKTSIFGSKMLSAEEMKNIRVSKEKEWINMKKNNNSNNFKDSLKVDGVTIPKDEEKDNERNINIKTERENLKEK